MTESQHEQNKPGANAPADDLSRGRARYDCLVGIGCQIAHDIRNDLFPIRAHADMMSQKLSAENELHTGLQQISMASLELAETLDQLQLLSRSEWRQTCRIDLKSYLKHTAVVLRYALAPQVRVNEAAPQDLPDLMITLDPGPVQIRILDSILETQACGARFESLFVGVDYKHGDEELKLLTTLSFESKADISESFIQSCGTAICGSPEFEPHSQTLHWQQSQLQLGLKVAASHDASSR